MPDDASKNLSRLADNVNGSTANEKMISFPHVLQYMRYAIAHNIQSKIHTYFSFLNLDNLTVLDAMNLSHSHEYMCG